MTKLSSNNIPQMEIVKCKLEGLLLIKRDPGIDNRGFFREVYRKSILSEYGVDFEPVQMNHSLSETNIIRGIHAEKWNKLVYPLTGKMFVPMVDLRVDSPTFGEHEDFMFDCTKGNIPNQALYIPKGFGNSICAMEGPVNYIYIVDAYWTPDSSFAVNPFDKDLGIKWPIKEPIVLEKDLNAPSLRERFPKKFK